LAALRVRDDDEGLAGKRRHRAVAAREAVLDVEWLPRARLLVLAEAARVARRIAERGHADDAGPRAADAGPDQAPGAADGGVGARAGAEGAGGAVELHRRAHRPVDDEDRRHRVGSAREADEIERVVAHRPDRGD